MQALVDTYLHKNSMHKSSWELSISLHSSTTLVSRLPRRFDCDDYRLGTNNTWVFKIKNFLSGVTYESAWFVFA